MHRVKGEAIVASIHEGTRVWIELSPFITITYPRKRPDRDPRVGSRIVAEYGLDLSDIHRVWVDGRLAYERA